MQCYYLSIFIGICCFLKPRILLNLLAFSFVYQSCIFCDAFVTPVVTLLRRQIFGYRLLCIVFLQCHLKQGIIGMSTLIDFYKNTAYKGNKVVIHTFLLVLFFSAVIVLIWLFFDYKIDSIRHTEL